MNIINPGHYIIESLMPCDGNESNWQAKHNPKWNADNESAWNWVHKEHMLTRNGHEIKGLIWSPYSHDVMIFETKEEAKELLDKYTDEKSGAKIVTIAESHISESWIFPE